MFKTIIATATVGLLAASFGQTASAGALSG